jgi:hypothetical protein
MKATPNALRPSKASGVTTSHRARVVVLKTLRNSEEVRFKKATTLNRFECGAQGFRHGGEKSQITKKLETELFFATKEHKDHKKIRWLRRRQNYHGRLNPKARRLFAKS